MSPSQAQALLSAPALHTPHPTRWADLGCGSGLFTLALATFLQPGSTIYAVDLRPAIKSQRTPNQVSIESIKADFTRQDLPFHDLDGILMANSLHYVNDKASFIQRLKTTILRPRHSFLIVEYDTDTAVSTWVPYPLSFSKLQSLFHSAGYSTITRLVDSPSIYNRSTIYSALIN
jgi:ubiquinone/menaquinone biosynthesis C-methylase UbiE